MSLNDNSENKRISQTNELKIINDSKIFITQQEKPLHMMEEINSESDKES